MGAMAPIEQPNPWVVFSLFIYIFMPLCHNPLDKKKFLVYYTHTKHTSALDI
jgi:hypothetical protein